MDRGPASNGDTPVAGRCLPGRAATGATLADPAGDDYRAQRGGYLNPAALLNAHLGAVARARKGRRYVTLYGAARGVARMVAAGAITPDDGRAALTDAGRAAGQTDWEIRTAIAGGFRDEGVPT